MPTTIGRRTRETVFSGGPVVPPVLPRAGGRGFVIRWRTSESFELERGPYRSVAQPQLPETATVHQDT